MISETATLLGSFFSREAEGFSGSLNLLSMKSHCCLEDIRLVIFLSCGLYPEAHVLSSTSPCLLRERCVLFWSDSDRNRRVSCQFSETRSLSTRFCSAWHWNSGSLQLSAEQLWGNKSSDLSLKHFGCTQINQCCIGLHQCHSPEQVWHARRAT